MQRRSIFRRLSAKLVSWIISLSKNSSRSYSDRAQQPSSRRVVIFMSLDYAAREEMRRLNNMVPARANSATRFSL
jgi:hypothetical protein